jgi:uncharacterized protein
MNPKNPQISQQYSIWDQMGSKVILGDMLVIPIENVLLYIEPLYIRAQDGELPELQCVLAKQVAATTPPESRFRPRSLAECEKRR